MRRQVMRLARLRFAHAANGRKPIWATFSSVRTADTSRSQGTAERSECPAERKAVCCSATGCIAGRYSGENSRNALLFRK